MTTEISPLTNGLRPSPQTTSASNTISTDYDTFLQMLTAQAQYQDPLEPIDSSDYAAQLAQFSMVEQQTLTNETLATLTEMLGASDLTQMSNWVGKEVRAIAPKNFDGTPVTISSTPVENETDAYLVVRDSAGSVIDKVAVPNASGPITWQGRSADGSAFPHGMYSFAIQSYQNGKLLDEVSAATYHNVVEAQIENDNVILILKGGQAILAEHVTAVSTGPDPG